MPQGGGRALEKPMQHNWEGVPTAGAPEVPGVKAASDLPWGTTDTAVVTPQKASQPKCGFAGGSPGLVWGAAALAPLNSGPSLPTLSPAPLQPLDVSFQMCKKRVDEDILRREESSVNMSPLWSRGFCLVPDCPCPHAATRDKTADHQ